MPVGTVTGAPKTFELKTAPPDGFVKVRTMSFGEAKERDDIVVKFATETPRDNPEGIRIGTERVTWEMANFATSLFDFQRCVLDHNITDENGRKLNLATAIDLRQLDPRIGEEIESYIREMNRFTEKEKEQFRDGDSRLYLESDDPNATQLLDSAKLGDSTRLPGHGMPTPRGGSA